MTILKKLFFLFFCQSLAFCQDVTEEGTNPSNNYIFDLPDIVANFETLGEEVQLEAFGAREVTFLSCEIHFKKKFGLHYLATYICHLTSISQLCVAKIIQCVAK
jgi:hypothetical protein